jgi:hypothetical protein
VSAGNVDPYSRLAEILTNRMYALRIAVVHVEADRRTQCESLAETILDDAPRRSPKVSGAIVVGGGAAGVLAGMLAQRGLPLIRISNARHDDGISRIYLDATGGIDTAVAHLVHLGHRRIGLAVLRDSAAPARIAGFRKVDGRHPPHSRHPRSGPRRRGRRRSDGRSRRRRRTHRSALHCGHRVRSRRCRSACSRPPSVCASTCPGTCPLLTVGDVPDADVIEPPLSQVVYDWATVAQSAIDEIRGR